VRNCGLPEGNTRRPHPHQRDRPAIHAPSSLAATLERASPRRNSAVTEL
jgi:hypothetical protein